MNGIPVLLIGGKKESGKSTVAKVAEEQLGAVSVSFAAPMKRFCAALGMPLDNLWGSTAKRDEVIETPEFFKEMPNLTSYKHEWKGWATFSKAFDSHLKDVLKHAAAQAAVSEWVKAEWLWLNGGYHGEGEKHLFTCRHALQTLGTECGRSINPDCWGNYGLEVAFKILTGEYAYDQQVFGLTRKERTDQPPKMVAIDDCRFPNELLIGSRLGAKSIYVDRPATSANAGGHASETSLDLIPTFWWGATLRNDRDLPTLNRLAKHKMNALGFSNGLEDY